MEALGTILWFTGSVIWARWITRLIDPWPQWTLPIGIVILVTGIAAMAAIVGIIFTP